VLSTEFCFKGANNSTFNPVRLVTVFGPVSEVVGGDEAFSLILPPSQVSSRMATANSTLLGIDSGRTGTLGSQESLNNVPLE